MCPTKLLMLLDAPLCLILKILLDLLVQLITSLTFPFNLHFFFQHPSLFEACSTKSIISLFLQQIFLQKLFEFLCKESWISYLETSPQNQFAIKRFKPIVLKTPLLGLGSSCHCVKKIIEFYFLVLLKKRSGVLSNNIIFISI